MTARESAYREFHRLYFDRLYQFLLAVTHGHRDAAQDALQETLLRVARKARRFDDADAFWSWLAAVARNVARDGGRKRRRYQALLDRFGLFRGDAADGGFVSENARSALQDAIQSLPSDERDLINGKYFAGRTVVELAQGLGVTEKTIESRLLRARRRLANLVKRIER